MVATPSRPPCAPDDADPLEARVRHLLACPGSKGFMYLHAFPAVGTGSFYAARERLDVKHTYMVKRKVKALEKLLARKLFTSDLSGHVNTPEGDRLLAILNRPVVSDAHPHG